MVLISFRKGGRSKLNFYFIIIKRRSLKEKFERTIFNLFITKKFSPTRLPSLKSLIKYRVVTRNIRVCVGIVVVRGLHVRPQYQDVLRLDIPVKT